MKGAVRPTRRGCRASLHSGAPCGPAEEARYALQNDRVPRRGRAGHERRAADVRLYTPAEAAAILQVRESWLRKKASARAVPCTFIGKHLRFSEQDIEAIIAAGAKQPVVRRRGRR
ncbi:helix-turn-helix domain-containing protein [Actinomadura sp. WAC 06369]|uniref:helix-turn-helix domain-containing protein n=1 Tax=Actinomadura sp. WAC 06369 TaxID=2203193 RepID=UPI002D7678DA|nr:helix-turn-helix domain-containing protein [Actinomadura sp. WAC 06369]